MKWGGCGHWAGWPSETLEDGRSSGLSFAPVAHFGLGLCWAQLVMGMDQARCPQGASALMQEKGSVDGKVCEAR